MQKTLRVLAVIAVVAALVQVFDLVVEVIKPEQVANEYAASFAQTARLRWIIYWPSGLAFLIIGGFIRKKVALLSNSLLIGGAYLMLLGNNGGLWASGHELERLITSIATLIVFSFITFRLDRRSKGSDSQEGPSCNESHEGNSAQV